MKTKIAIGDIVDVFFTRSEPELKVEVAYVPQSEGDCFIVKRNDNKRTIVDIQTYEKIVHRGTVSMADRGGFLPNETSEDAGRS